MTARFDVLQEWTGFVVETKALGRIDFGSAQRDPTGSIKSIEGIIEAVDVTVHLQDVTDPTRPEEVATLRVPIPDNATPGHTRLVAHLMVQGAYFRWRIGYLWDEKGTRRRHTEITAIEEQWTQQEIDAARQEADDIRRVLGIDT